MRDRDFSRQSFLGEQSEEVLAGTRVTIVGLGGGGSHIAQQLAHLGVGEIRLIDPDAIEPSNLNRLVGATHDDIVRQTPKVTIAERMIRSVRPWIKIRAEKQKWQAVDSLLRDSHVIFGCIDGYQQRAYLEAAARRFLVPYIDIGMDVSELGKAQYAVAGQMIVTLPDGPCMHCIGFLTSERLNQEENRYGAAGGNPQVVWTNGTLASLAVGAFVQLASPWDQKNLPYVWLELDGNTQTVTASRQPTYLHVPDKCPHHGGRDGIGDPFFQLGFSTGQ